MEGENLWLKLLNQSSVRASTPTATCIVLGNLNGRVNVVNSLSSQKQVIRPISHLEILNYSYFDVEDSALANPTKVHLWQLDEKTLLDPKDFLFCAALDEPLSFVVALDMTVGEEGVVEALKRWMTYLHVFIKQHHSKHDEQARRDIENRFLQYLLSARMSKGSVLEKSGEAEHEELSGRARYELAVEHFPYPVIVIGCNLEQIDANNMLVMKSMRELQGKLRSMCLEVGAGLLYTNNEEASATQIKRYLLHRLYPESISMDLKVNDKIHGTFIPSGFDSVDLIAVSSGVKAEKDAIHNLITYTEKKLEEWSTEVKDRQKQLSSTASISSFSSIESEQDWMQSLHTFIAKFTADISAKQSSGNLTEALQAEAETENAQKPKIEQIMGSTGSGKEGGPPVTRRGSIINRPVTTDKKDVGDFFKNLMEGGGKPAKK